MNKPIVTALMAFLLDTQTAFACRWNEPIGNRIARSDPDTVILAEVKTAAYGTPDNCGRPWTGYVALKRILRGNTVASEFTVGRSGCQPACDDGIPSPKPGDTWVVYLKGNEQLLVYGNELAYPLDIARTADPDLEKLLAAGPTK
jgi:hypothetical protein